MKKLSLHQKVEFKMISNLIRENSSFLNTLCHTKSQSKIRRLLRLASTSQLLTLVEICLNIVKSRFILTTRQKKRLMPYACFVRGVSRARSTRGAKHALQKGNGIGAFAALLTPILIELARSIKSGN